MTRPKPLILLIVDGFGISLEEQANPVALAKKPALDELDHFFPFTVLQASGAAVGLPWGKAGNSEVGHLTMGAGKMIHHHLPRIIYSIFDGSFFKNPALLKATEHVKKNNSRLHVAGLVSSGSVHSYLDHLYALFDFTQREGVHEVFLHVFSDGKDAPPEEGAGFLRTLEERMAKEWPHVKLASVVGRFYALDRGEQWDRTRTAYELLTMGTGTPIVSIPEYIAASYADGVTDEFIKPAFLTGSGGEPIGLVRPHDALLFSDFREDSMRQIVRAFTEHEFPFFPRERVDDLLVVTLTEYAKGLSALAAFPQLHIADPLAHVLGAAGLRHLHIAETQKYAHVTYFFNGGSEEPFPGEERILIPSLNVSHFDAAPEMRTREIVAKILEVFGEFDVIIANLASADMVGHSGNFAAGIRAVEVIDEAIGALAGAIFERGGVMMVTADHGNIELKRNVLSGEALTEHSTNPVPFYLVGRDYQLPVPRSPEAIMERKKEVGGILTDVAPTILELLGIPKPDEMTGTSLLSLLTRQREEG